MCICKRGPVWIYLLPAAQIEFFPLSAILKNELIRPLIEFVLHRRRFLFASTKREQKGLIISPSVNWPL